MDATTQKSRLLDQLQSLLEDRIEENKKSIAAARESRDSDTKSSAGDKYETGREMAQQEVNKLEAQLLKSQAMLRDLEQIDPNAKLEQIGFGSVVFSNQGNYFLSVALGKINLDESTFFCLSLASPIGQVLAGKKAGDTLVFNGENIVIEQVA